MLYPAYEARMLRKMPSEGLPKHIGVMLDGNRRWARAVGRDTAQGHRAGAANIEPLLGWCEEIGVEVVTLWLLSTDNLNRPAAELEPLLDIIGEAVETLAEQQRWRLHPVGSLDLLPAAMAERGHQTGGAGSRTANRRLAPSAALRGWSFAVPGASFSTAAWTPSARIQFARPSPSKSGKWSSTEAERGE